MTNRVVSIFSYPKIVFGIQIGRSRHTGKLMGVFSYVLGSYLPVGNPAVGAQW